MIERPPGDRDAAPQDSGTRLVRVGTAGWSYADWEGTVYPRPHPPGFHPLAFLARYVDCVELNSTFYALPRARHAAHWVELVREQPAFRFLAKLNQAFTHTPWTTPPRAEAEAFTSGLEPLIDAGRLSALLAQFPISFHFTAPNQRRLRDLARLFRRVPLVVEVRHRSWFVPEAFDTVERLGLGLAHIDLPAARDHPPLRHPMLGRVGYVRLHGRNAGAWFDRRATRDDRYDYLYGRDELEQVVERVRSVAAHGRETFLVTNNHYGGKALANAIEIRGLLDGDEPRAPQTLRNSFPHLAALTRPDGQQMLF